jgi:hypothetical protein
MRDSAPLPSAVFVPKEIKRTAWEKKSGEGKK